MAKKSRTSAKKGKRKPRFSKKQIAAMGLALREAEYEPER